MVTTDGGEEGRSPEGRREFPKSFMKIPSGGEFGEFVGGWGNGGREGASQESRQQRSWGSSAPPASLPFQSSCPAIPFPTRAVSDGLGVLPMHHGGVFLHSFTMPHACSLKLLESPHSTPKAPYTCLPAARWHPFLQSLLKVTPYVGSLSSEQLVTLCSLVPLLAL